MMIKLAWKNLFFYKGRSIATLVITFVMAYFFIVYVAFINGSHASMLENALDVYTGSLQIKSKPLQGEEETPMIEDERFVLDLLHNQSNIKAFSSRLEQYGMLSHEGQATALMLTGIDFGHEADISALKRARTEGTYDSHGSCLYVGNELARSVQIAVGSEVRFSGMTLEQTPVSDVFRVCGIFKTGMYEFDARSAFMNRHYFDTVFHTTNRASYVVAVAEDIGHNDATLEEIAEKLPPKLHVVGWKTLMKSMIELMEVDSLFGYISIGIFFLVIFFVVMIYGFINISSRIKELGMLKSIGVSAGGVDRLLVYEIVIVSVIALVLAMPLGAYTAYYFEVHPIVIPGMSDTYKSYGVVSDTVHTLFEPWTVAWNGALILGLNLLSVLYPIIHVRSFTPVEAMRHV